MKSVLLHGKLPALEPENQQQLAMMRWWSSNITLFFVQSLSLSLMSASAVEHLWLQLSFSRSPGVSLPTLWHPTYRSTSSFKQSKHISYCTFSSHGGCHKIVLDAISSLSLAVSSKSQSSSSYSSLLVRRCCQWALNATWSIRLLQHSSIFVFCLLS